MQAVTKQFTPSVVTFVLNKRCCCNLLKTQKGSLSARLVILTETDYGLIFLNQIARLALYPYILI